MQEMCPVGLHFSTPYFHALESRYENKLTSKTYSSPPPNRTLLKFWSDLLIDIFLLYLQTSFFIIDRCAKDGWSSAGKGHADELEQQAHHIQICWEEKPQVGSAPFGKLEQLKSLLALFGSYAIYFFSKCPSAMLFREAAVLVFYITQIQLVQARSSHSRSHSKRSAHSRECANDADAEMHAIFSRMVNRRDEQMFSYFQPENQVLLEFQPTDRKLLTPRTQVCDALERSAEVLPGQPLLERSVCPYHHVLNYNPQRVPATITEVECSCQSVQFAGGSIHCEPMYYNLRVLLFSDGCGKFVETVQRVALACVPVFSNQLSAGGTIAMIRPTSPAVPV
ncbi:unnamed protein product [Caenorhabditis auriculariae]|uniref:Uncharacterized protein n=1 Tax=Caenorhabditis auriculariae TaxID=2777116 RepID=A0A8S1H7N4_9PELO|nr:unnamed protein product [Caenorhabditis auriculariae]